MHPTSEARARLRFIGLLLFIALSIVLAVVVLRQAPMTPEGVREVVLAWGALAPLAYIALVALRPLVFFPSWLLFVTAGIVFGPVLGTLYGVTGAVIAASFTFLLARRLGREFVQARLPARLQRFQDAELGAGLVFFFNLVPIVPVTAINYGAGLSRVPFPHYALAVVGGLTPRAFAYTYFGDALLDPTAKQLLIAVAGLALLVLIPMLFRKRWFARWQKKTA